MPKLYSYIITADNGKSPCYDKGTFSLACCKPQIRRILLQNYLKEIKDGTDNIWLCGIQRKNKNPFVVFLARIDDVLRLEEYYGDNTLYAKRSDCNYRNIKTINTVSPVGKLQVKLTSEDIFKKCPRFMANPPNEHGEFENYDEFYNKRSKSEQDCIVRDISGASVLLSKHFIHCSCFNERQELTRILTPALSDLLNDYRNKNRRCFYGYDKWKTFYDVVSKIDLGEHDNIKAINPNTKWNEKGGWTVC